MKLYALCTLHEVSLFFHLVTTFLTHCHPFQTGWGTRAGIGDAAAATAALDRQAEEKNDHTNNPFRRQSHHSGEVTVSSPFKDVPPSPYRDEPTQTLAYHYTTKHSHTPRNRSLSNRRRPTDELELQTSVAR